MNNKRKPSINYLKILAQKYQNTPAWRDLALACNNVLGQEIDEKRRKLERIRDSVKYRRGDTLTNFEYRPVIDKPAIKEIDRSPVSIPVGYIIEVATVKNVVKNIVFYQQPDGTDYLDLSFIYNDEVCRWLKPINITQERDALLKNSAIMGFDFFSSKMNDEDLQRVYENIQIYWEESGTSDNFMKFIGFIKNTTFDLVYLWTEDSETYPSDDPNTEYPYLEPFNNETMTSVKDGGSNWQTSHVQIEYDLAQFDKYYVVNLEDFEQLFYFFAPIILVLERITGTLKIETPIRSTNAAEVTSFNYDVLQPPTSFKTLMKSLTSYSVETYTGGCINTRRKGCLGLDSRVDLSQRCFDFLPYLASTGII